MTTLKVTRYIAITEHFFQRPFEEARKRGKSRFDPRLQLRIRKGANQKLHTSVVQDITFSCVYGALPGCLLIYNLLLRVWSSSRSLADVCKASRLLTSEDGQNKGSVRQSGSTFTEHISFDKEEYLHLMFVGQAR
jgi:hypothetical protein